LGLAIALPDLRVNWHLIRIGKYMAEDYKKAVLDRFKDAVILYCNERYIASLYMSGYVIEIGIKVELARLSVIEINEQNKLMRVINELSKNNAQLPFSVKDFLHTIQKIKKVDNTRTINVIFDKKSNDHDIREFLEKLQKWKQTIGENTFSIDDYDIQQKCGWKTGLRYGDEPATNNSNSEQQEAKNALNIAIKFLNEVAYLSLNEDMRIVREYENIFANANNEISSDENEISSREQTINNED
jgi:Ulp1 family protease